MKIEHIALYVNDLEKTRSFFMKYLGAKSNEGYHNLKTNFRSYFLSFDDGARLEIMNKPEMPDLPKELARTGYAHIAFSVGSKEKVSDNGHEKYSYPSLDTPFEESMGIGYSKIDREIPIELNKEIPICVKIGTSSNRMEVLDITEDFRKIECDAGIAVTITVSDEIVE